MTFQHTATRRWLPGSGGGSGHNGAFQHTATRRWLLCRLGRPWGLSGCFNTQPPEGGCHLSFLPLTKIWFQHTATRRWLRLTLKFIIVRTMFQHTATRRWLLPSTIYTKQQAAFQHTATRRWLPMNLYKTAEVHTAPPPRPRWVAAAARPRIRPRP